MIDLRLGNPFRRHRSDASASKDTPKRSKQPPPSEDRCSSPTSPVQSTVEEEGEDDCEAPGQSARERKSGRSTSSGTAQVSRVKVATENEAEAIDEDVREAAVALVSSEAAAQRAPLPPVEISSGAADRLVGGAADAGDKPGERLPAASAGAAEPLASAVAFPLPPPPGTACSVNAPLAQQVEMVNLLDSTPVGAPAASARSSAELPAGSCGGGEQDLSMLSLDPNAFDLGYGPL